MANATVRGQVAQLAQYLPDGDIIASFLQAIVNSLTPAERAADNFVLYTFEQISTTKDEIDDDPGAKPLLFIAKSTGTKCYVHFHNADADSVTAGVDVDFLVPVGATSGEVTVIAAGGKSWDTFWDTGLTVSASTTTETSSAPSNKPTIWVLLLGS